MSDCCESLTTPCPLFTSLMHTHCPSSVSFHRLTWATQVQSQSRQVRTRGMYHNVRIQLVDWADCFSATIIRHWLHTHTHTHTHTHACVPRTVRTLLSPPDTARMFPVTDQLTCHTTSLNLCSTFEFHVELVPSFVQMITRQSCVQLQHEMHNELTAHDFAVFRSHMLKTRQVFAEVSRQKPTTGQPAHCNPHQHQHI